MRITRLYNKGLSQADAYKKIIKDNKTQTYRHYEADYGTRTALSETKRPSDCELRGSSLDACLIAPQYYRSWNQLFGINLINYFNDYKNKKNWLLNLRFWNDSHQMWETTTACGFACLLGAVEIFKSLLQLNLIADQKKTYLPKGSDCVLTTTCPRHLKR